MHHRSDVALEFRAKSGTFAWQALLAAIALASAASVAAAPLKVGFVYVGPASDGGWSYQHNLGRLALEREFGSKIETTYVENVPESADAERVIRQLAAKGYTLIFTTSFGYMEPTLKVAKLFPQVHFEHATGYKTAANVVTYEAQFYEGAYLLGVLAGKMTKSNTLGYVASFPISEVIRNIDAFTLGARSVNPKIRTKVCLLYTSGRSKFLRHGSPRAAGQFANIRQPRDLWRVSQLSLIHI